MAFYIAIGIFREAFLGESLVALEAPPHLTFLLLALVCLLWSSAKKEKLLWIHREQWRLRKMIRTKKKQKQENTIKQTKNHKKERVGSCLAHRAPYHPKPSKCAKHNESTNRSTTTKGLHQPHINCAQTKFFTAPNTLSNNKHIDAHKCSVEGGISQASFKPLVLKHTNGKDTKPCNFSQLHHSVKSVTGPDLPMSAPCDWAQL